jgi:hypothetical protein
MNDILIKTFIEKLEALEKTSTELKEKVDRVTEYSPAFKDLGEKIRMIQMEIRSIPEKISIPGEEIRAQRITMAELSAQLMQPLLQKEKHVHHLSKPLFCCIFLVMLIVALCFWIGQLYEYIYERGNIPPYHVISVPSTNNPENSKLKLHRSKDKNQSNKNPPKSFQLNRDTSDESSSK